MKKTLLLLTLLVSGLSMAQGQGDLTIYSNTGAKFYVILNGIRQNQNPETNVKVTGLNNRWYSCKIISEDKSFEIEKNVGVKFDTLITYRILDKKGKYKLRFYSETSLGTSTAAPDQTVIVYHTSDTPLPNTDNNPTETSNTTITTSSTTTTTNTNDGTTQQVTINEGGNGSESINMNVSFNENGMNANVNISDTGTTTEQSGMTTTTTTTSSAEGLNGSTYYEESTSNTGNGTTTTTYYEETTTTSSTTGTGNNNVQNNNVQNNNVNYNNCYTSDADVKNMQTQIEKESFEDDQLRVAKLAAKNKCMSVAQIKTIANTFTFDDNKLSFLKTAYDNCTDQSNYYQLLETLTFSSDKEALESFINSRN